MVDLKVTRVTTNVYTQDVGRDGLVAQLGERMVCNHDVVGSIPIGSNGRLAQLVEHVPYKDVVGSSSLSLSTWVDGLAATMQSSKLLRRGFESCSTRSIHDGMSVNL